MQSAQTNSSPFFKLHPAAGTVVIADDLSGAAECASEFAVPGFPTELALTQSGAMSGVMVWDLDAREVRQPLSLQVTRAMQQARRGFVKVDSLLRGGWAHLVGSAVRGAGHPALMCTALPRLGRAMRGGRVELVRASSHDRSGPIEYCRASAVHELAALGMRARHLAIAPGENLRDSLLARMREQEVTIVDAHSEEQLLQLAQALESLPFPYLAVGSAGLAGALARSLGISAWHCAAPPLPRRCAVIVGSLTHRAREQLDRLATASGQPVRWWEHGAGMTTSAPPSHQHDALHVYATSASTAQGLTGRALTDAFVRAVLGDLSPVDCFIVTGGETARALCDALGVVRLQVLGQVEQGVSLAKFQLATSDKYLILKSGSFGDIDTLLRMARLSHPATN